MKVLLLGTAGGYTPRIDRAQPATAVVSAEGAVLLFDCGAGVTRQLVRAGIKPHQVGPLFITHHHWDHTADYAYFALSSWFMGRVGPLHVYGPPPTERMTHLLFDNGGAFEENLREIMGSGGAQAIFRFRHGRDRDALDVRATEINEPGIVAQAADWTVRAAFTPHVEPFFKSCAYRVDSGGGSVVISGDTGCPSETILELARGCDVLVHECTRPDDDLARLGISNTHTGPEALGRLAAEAGVRKLVLTHFSVDYGTPAHIQQMVGSVKRWYGGEVVAGEDLQEIAT